MFLFLSGNWIDENLEFHIKNIIYFFEIAILLLELQVRSPIPIIKRLKCNFFCSYTAKGYIKHQTVHRILIFLWKYKSPDSVFLYVYKGRFFLKKWAKNSKLHEIFKTLWFICMVSIFSRTINFSEKTILLSIDDKNGVLVRHCMMQKIGLL